MTLKKYLIANSLHEIDFTNSIDIILKKYKYKTNDDILQYETVFVVKIE